MCVVGGVEQSSQSRVITAPFVCALLVVRLRATGVTLGSGKGKRNKEGGG